MEKIQTYTPLLKGKKGEFDALSTLTAEAKQRLTPLIDVPPIDWDFNNERPKKTLEKHLDDYMKKLTKAWNSTAPFFIDLNELDSAKRTTEGKHVVEYIVELLMQTNLSAILVTGPDRDEEYQKAITTALKRTPYNLAVRFPREDCESVEKCKSKIQQILNDTGKKAKEVAVVMDFRFLRVDDINPCVAIAVEAINAFRSIGSFRSICLAASALPEHMGSIDRDSSMKIDRLEVSLWEKASAEIPSDFQLGFGDYGVQHPDLLTLDPRIINPSANIRYTLERHLLILKGQGVRGEKGHSQFHALSQKLIDGKDYRGSNYSWGDAYIAECAAGNAGPGNLTTWRAVGTNHHLTLVGQFVADSIAS